MENHFAARCNWHTESQVPIVNKNVIFGFPVFTCIQFAVVVVVVVCNLFCIRRKNTKNNSARIVLWLNKKKGITSIVGDTQICVRIFLRFFVCNEIGCERHNEMSHFLRVSAHCSPHMHSKMRVELYIVLVFIVFVFRLASLLLL